MWNKGEEEVAIVSSFYGMESRVSIASRKHQHPAQANVHAEDVVPVKLLPAQTMLDFVKGGNSRG
jgi:hypothetical protein